MVRNGVREFVYDAEEPAFVKKELVEFGVDMFSIFAVQNEC